jgi:hypothetical protein
MKYIEKPPILLLVIGGAVGRGVYVGVGLGVEPDTGVSVGIGVGTLVGVGVGTEVGVATEVGVFVGWTSDGLVIAKGLLVGVI